MQGSTEGTHRVVVRRRLPAPREVVFEAWTDPEGIAQWMCPGDVISAEAVMDVRAGGSYRITMKSKDRDHVHAGTYQVVEPPSKLVFTWSAIENPAEVTLVTVEFFAQADETDLVLTHERFLQGDVAERYKKGWGTIAQKFGDYLARRPKVKKAY
jgi:uncharacterized protein YndB with AHSA1/START domain